MINYECHSNDLLNNAPCSPDKCTGCLACMSICPQGAIAVARDEKGYFRPIIDKTKCVNCSLCERTCRQSFDRTSTPNTGLFRTKEIYGLKNKNERIRRLSSSGGAFFLLAEEIINNDGVVYGCVLDENIEAVFARAKTIDECYPMLGSKYVQCNTEGIYHSIENDLMTGHLVLFSGSPCQCDALNIYLNVKKVDKSNLLTVEFLCHGGPSPLFFDGYKNRLQKKYKGQIIKFVFRDKEKVKNPPSSRGMRAVLKCDNSSIGEKKTLDIYDEKMNNQHFELFKRNYVSQECCYKCRYIGFENRAADFTLADFWGCDKKYPDFYDTHGISLVLLNSNKALGFFGKIKKRAEIIRVEEDKCLQTPLVKAPTKPVDFDKFWDFYMDNGYERTVIRFSRKYILINYYYGFISLVKKKLYSILNKQPR